MWQLHPIGRNHTLDILANLAWAQFSLLNMHEVCCGLGEGRFVVEVDWEVDAFVVVGVEDDGVGLDEGIAVGSVFVSEDEEVDSPGLDEVFELFVVVSASPCHEVC